MVPLQKESFLKTTNGASLFSVLMFKQSSDLSEAL